MIMFLSPNVRPQKSKQKRTENAEDKNEPISSQAVQEDGDR